MATRIPASQRTREELRSLIEGRLSTGSAKDELVKLATRLIVEEALEGEASDTIGREYYEHGAQPGQGYRNGHRTGRLKTAEGLMEYSAPQIAGRDEPFRSAIREHLKGHTQGLEDLAVEMLARGLSVRDIEDAFKDESGRLLLSKSAVSQLGERLWEDYQAFAQGFLRTSPQFGARPRTIDDDQVAAVIKPTLRTTPADATHWSIRSMAAETGFSHTTIRRMGRHSACSHTVARRSGCRTPLCSSTRYAISSSSIGDVSARAAAAVTSHLEMAAGTL
jgi:regulator of RNase E activity RraB